MNNLKQIGLALQSYQSSIAVFPPAYVTSFYEYTSEIGNHWGWGSMIFGQLGDVPLFSSINFSTSVVDPAVETAREVRISIYLCPSSDDFGPVAVRHTGNREQIDQDLAPGQYVASAGTRALGPSPVFSIDEGRFTRNSNEDGVMYRNSSVRPSAITDGMSTTLLAGERSRDLADATWVGARPIMHTEVCTRSGTTKRECVGGNILVLGHTGPENIDHNPAWVDRPNYRASGADGYSSRHPGGCNFLFCDGSVRLVKDSIDPRVFAALATRSRSEAIPADGP